MSQQQTQQTAIARRDTAVQLGRTAAPRPVFTDAQRQIIRDTIANGASDEEFVALMAIAEAKGLNPITKQVYFVKRFDSQRNREVWEAQVGIDGLRVIAERTGLYEGQGEPTFEVGKDGKLISCRVEVFRRDWSRSAVGVAYYEESVQKTKQGEPTKFWRTMPRTMLAKCAEAQAFRRAFPGESAGLGGEGADLVDAIQQEEQPEPRRVESRSAHSEAPPHDAITGEVLEPSAPEASVVAAALMREINVARNEKGLEILGRKVAATPGLDDETRERLRARAEGRLAELRSR